VAGRRGRNCRGCFCQHVALKPIGNSKIPALLHLKLFFNEARQQFWNLQ
jgi:hypothetical protein